MELVKNINHACRFLLEIGAFAAVGYWGFKLNGLGLWRYAIGLGAPLLVALIWALWGAPMAPYRLEGSGKLALELAIFSLAVVALYASSQKGAAAGMGVAVAVNTLILYLVK